MRRQNRRRSVTGRRRRSRSWFSGLKLWKKVMICFVTLVLTGTVSLVVYGASKLGKVNTTKIDVEDIIINKEVREAAQETDNEVLGEGYLNVALFGVDSREGRVADSTLSDCIIVASLNRETREIKMVSVYRDTLLDVGGDTLTKCNAAYSFGGPTQAINMLNANLDLDITKYVTVDFAVISEVIDQLGGVEIDVKEEEVQYINEFIDETAAVADKLPNYVYEAGSQLLDGVQATTYARIRSTAGGDFTRTERQRYVIEKMVEKIQKSDAAVINRVLDRVLPTIYTNFSAAEILFYAKDFQKYVLGDNTGFPFDKALDMLSGVGSVVIPTDLVSNVTKLHEFLFGVVDYTPSPKVEDNSYAIVVRAGNPAPMEGYVADSQRYERTFEGGQQEFSQGEGWQGAGEGVASVGLVSGGRMTGNTDSGAGDAPESGAGDTAPDSEGSIGSPGDGGTESNIVNMDGGQ